MYKKILVPLDGSDLAACVLPHVESVATGCSVPEVVLLQVVEMAALTAGSTGSDQTDFEYGIPADYKEKIDKTRTSAAETYLNKVASQLKEKGVDASPVMLSTEDISAKGGPAVKAETAELIVHYIEKNDIDLVIIATHGRSGISRWAFGSVADRILRSSCVPILMVRAPGCVAGI
jgi:nucleotide-binding universal stress UspA family protein